MATTQKIGPHAESGFGPQDVLREAEQGDEIRVELDLYGQFLDASGRVDNVHDEIDSEPTVRRTVYVDADRDDEDVDLLEIVMVYDPDSAYASAMRVHALGDDGEWEEHEIDDLAMCELERDLNE